MKKYSLRAVKGILTKKVGKYRFSTLNGKCIFNFGKEINFVYLQNFANKIENTEIQDCREFYKCGVTLYIPFKSLFY